MKIETATFLFSVGEIKILNGPVGGFLFHPRSDSSPTGVDPSGVALPGAPIPYPLRDGDHGTRRITLDDDGWALELSPAENYGNVDWKGGSDSDSPVLTWRGPPGRCIPLTLDDGSADYTTYIESLTNEDDMGVDDTGLPVQQYTVFSSEIYEAGAKIADAPGRVLGAAYRTLISPLSGTVLACICWNRYDEWNPFGGTVNPEGGEGGFFYEYFELVDAAWVRLAFIRGERPSTPFFFNASGSAAASVQQYSVYRFDGIGFTMSPLVSGTQTVLVEESAVTGVRPTDPSMSMDYLKGAGPAFNPKAEDVTDRTVTITKDAARILCIDYKGDIEVVRSALLTGNDVSHVTSTKYDDYALVPVFSDTLPVTLSVSPNPVQIGSVITVGHGFPPYSVSMAGGSISKTTDSTWTITGFSTCVPGAVAAVTINVTDCGGATASLTLRRAGGSYVMVAAADPCPTCSVSGDYGGTLRVVAGLDMNYQRICPLSETRYQVITVDAWFSPGQSDPHYGLPSCGPMPDFNADGVTYHCSTLRYEEYEWRCP